MGLEQNLIAARKVISLVRAKLVHGSNTREDEKQVPRIDENRMAALRTEVEIRRNEYKKSEKKEPHPITNMIFSAQGLDKYGMGYCGEQAEAAFLYLMLMDVYPIKLCLMSESKHELVVIGEKNDAVVCDPWANKAYPLSQLPQMQKAQHNVPFATFFQRYNPLPYLTGNLVSMYREERRVGIYLMPNTLWEMVPVPTSTYRTVDFANNTERVLFSDAVSACVVLVIRNGNIATMAHFFPNNAYDETTAENNIKKAILDFMDAGGKLNTQTTFNLYGGSQLPGERYIDGPKAIMEDTITKQMKLDRKYQFDVHHPSLNRSKKEKIFVYVDKKGTDVIKSKQIGNTVAHANTLVTPNLTALPLSFMANAPGFLPDDYNKFGIEWSGNIAKIGADKNLADGMPLLSIKDAISKPWDEIKAQIPLKNGTSLVL